MLGYLSADIRGQIQIMSKDKYPSIFSQPNWGYCVYYPSILKIGEYPRIFPSFSWGIFAHVTCLDQSRASENIWWIIINNIRVKGDKTKMKNNPIRLSLETWCSLFVPQCAASNKGKWNSWCLYLLHFLTNHDRTRFVPLQAPRADEAIQQHDRVQRQTLFWRNQTSPGNAIGGLPFKISFCCLYKQ